jgi:hypothetical protein
MPKCLYFNQSIKKGALRLFYGLMLCVKNFCDGRGLGLARGHSPYRIQIIGVGAIPPWLPCFASSNKFSPSEFHVTSVYKGS